VIERKRLNSKSKSKSKSKSVRVALACPVLFGEPQLLEGEDAAAYDELLARFRAAVKPVDIIEEMFIAEVVALEWEVLRWRRLKLGLIRARGLEALKSFLAEDLDLDLYRDDLVDELTEILQDNLPEGQEKDFARTLAYQCAENEPKAVDEVKKLLNSDDWDFDNFLDDTRADKRAELVQEYAQRTPGAVTRINKLLAGAGVSMDSITAEALAEKFDYVERIDRLTTIAENRRNDALHELDRHRALFGEALRRTVQELEDVEYEEIGSTRAKRKNAA
jgi:hypothetical protein